MPEGITELALGKIQDRVPDISSERNLAVCFRIGFRGVLISRFALKGYNNGIDFK